MEYTITKTKVECYKLRHKSGMYWADINVDAHEKAGRIQIASDYGSWQYYWGSCGSSFKEFLLDLDSGYVAGKFGADRWFDLERTIKSYKATVIQYRKGEDLTEEKAREIFDEIKQLEDCSSRDEFYAEIRGKENLMRFFDWSPDVVYGLTPEFRAFWKNVWPSFCDELRNEIYWEGVQKEHAGIA